jgi:hypothetical protein
MANTDFNLEGAKWGSADPGTAGGTVTWAVDSTIDAAALAQINAAFADWARVANIQFQEVAPSASANIDFTTGALDGAGGTLAETGFSFSNGQLGHADITYDSGDTFNNDLFVVTAHEIGHAIGLGHYDNGPAVMNSGANESLTNLTQSDIDGVQALYGANVATTPAEPAGNASGTPNPAPDTPVAGGDGAPAGGTTGMTAGMDPPAANPGADGGGWHHHGGGHNGLPNAIASLLQSFQGDHSGGFAELGNAIASAAGHGNGGPLADAIASVGNHADAAASAVDLHGGAFADLAHATSAHYEHLWH